VSETKHTPGPWTLAPCSHGGLILRRGPSDLKNRHPQSSLQIVPEADAHLIAAAPELYAALEDLLAETRAAGLGQARDFNWPEVTQAARSALARARGESEES